MKGEANMNVITAMIVTVGFALLFAGVRFLAMKDSSKASCDSDNCSSYGGCNVHDFKEEIKLEDGKKEDDLEK